MRTKLVLAVAIVGMLAWTGTGLATNFTWDGGGDGFTWSDPNNWDLNSSYPQTNTDTATFNGAASITAGLPQTIHFLTTGTGLVQFNNTLNFGPNADPQGVSIGTGGISVTGNLNSGMRSFSSAGPVTITGQMATSAYFPVQTAGTWNIGTIFLPNATGNIPAWNIVNGSTTTITQSYTTGTYTFTGTPNISGGRPNWALVGGAGLTVNLANYTLYGNSFQVDGWSGDPGRLTAMTANGGTVDVNTMAIAYGGNDVTYENSYINFANTTVGIHGNGTANFPAWDNRSLNSANWTLSGTGGTGVRSTVTFDSPSGTQLVHTGSTDNGTGGYTNNFAFANVKIGAGTTVQLSNNNTTGGAQALDTLYVKGYLQGGNNSILNLNGYKAYVDGGLTPGMSVGNMTINTGAGGAFLLTNNSEVLTFELGPTDALGVGLVGQNDHVQINGGTFTLDGILNMVDIGGENWSTGKLLYHLFDYTGSLVNNGLELGSGFPGPAYIDASIAGQINLIITPEPTMAMLALVGAGLLVLTRRRKAIATAAGILVLAALLASPATVRAVDYTWDGTGDGFTWSDPNNWDLNSGFPSTTADRAFFTGAANVTAGLPQTIHFLTTGSGLVQLNGSLSFGPNASPQGASVGAGGLSVTGSLTNMRDFTSAGNLTVTGTLSSYVGFPAQTGGTWNIQTIALPNGPGTIGWSLVNGANTTIQQGSITNGTYTIGSTLNITGGRPNWSFTYGGDGQCTIALGANTLYGNTLRLDGWPGGVRYTIMNGNGGIVDVNTMAIAYGNAQVGNTYINLANTTIGIHGNGTAANPAWDNRSTNTANWSLTGGTSGYSTVTFDAPSGTQFVHTGSTDSGTGGYTNNFAFGNVKIGTGTTVQLSNNDAPNTLDTLYVKGYLQGGNNSILNLNGYKAYVDGGLTPGMSVGNMTINTGTGGAFALTNNAEILTFELGPTDAFGVGLAGQNDHVQINGGTFTLDGILNMVDIGGENWSTGKLLYHLFDYTGSLVNNGLELGSGFPGPAFLDTSISGQVNLIITPEPGMALLGLIGTGLMVVRRRNRGE